MTFVLGIGITPNQDAYGTEQDLVDFRILMGQNNVADEMFSLYMSITNTIVASDTFLSAHVQRVHNIITDNDLRMEFDQELAQVNRCIADALKEYASKESNCVNMLNLEFKRGERVNDIAGNFEYAVFCLSPIEQKELDSFLFEYVETMARQDLKEMFLNVVEDYRTEVEKTLDYQSKNVSAMDVSPPASRRKP